MAQETVLEQNLFWDLLLMDVIQVSYPYASQLRQDKTRKIHKRLITYTHRLAAPSLPSVAIGAAETLGLIHRQHPPRIARACK